MITRFHVRNFKALHDVSLEMTPIHALIGRNDSGKSSILAALAALARSVDYPLGQSFVSRWSGRDLVWRGEPEGVVELSADVAATNTSRPFRYSLACRFSNTGHTVLVERETFVSESSVELTEKRSAQSLVRSVCIDNSSPSADKVSVCRQIHEALSGVQYFHWNPRSMALPVAPDATRRFRLNSDGFGLALLLDDILGFDRKRFERLESQFKSIFPEIGSIRLQRERAFRAPPDDIEQVSKLDQADGKGLYFELSDTTQLVPASQVSDGVILVLGYLAVFHSPEAPRLLLIEEPENGIHPKRLSDILRILRDVAKSQSHTQVVLTTHSPYAVDLFSAEEVTLCSKRADGSVEVTRMSDSAAVREQISLFSLGEIWTAEGEEDLVKGRAASPP